LSLHSRQLLIRPTLTIRVEVHGGRVGQEEVDEEDEGDFPEERMEQAALQQVGCGRASLALPVRISICYLLAWGLLGQAALGGYYYLEHKGIILEVQKGKCSPQ
jgi:hypothetical protein